MVTLFYVGGYGIEIDLAVINFYIQYRQRPYRCQAKKCNFQMFDTR